MRNVPGSARPSVADERSGTWRLGATRSDTVAWPLAVGDDRSVRLRGLRADAFEHDDRRVELPGGRASGAGCAPSTAAWQPVPDRGPGQARSGRGSASSPVAPKSRAADGARELRDRLGAAAVVVRRRQEQLGAEARRRRRACSAGGRRARGSSSRAPVSSEADALPPGPAEAQSTSWIADAATPVDPQHRRDTGSALDGERRSGRRAPCRSGTRASTRSGRSARPGDRGAPRSPRPSWR